MIALGCIPICYRLGWQISHNRWVALLSGLALALNPDIYFYSNYVMSDVANIFFVLLFSTLLLSALETLKPGWVFASLLTSSFAALLRSENILLLVIGSLALAAAGFEHWFRDHSPGTKKTFVHIGLAILTASLSVLWWSGHNLRVHNFFGLSNYMGVVLYDGWVYFGDASKLDFSDPSSSAVQELEAIAQRYPIAITDKSGVATGWETYPALIQSGYTDGQAIGLLRDAALDSIKKNPGLTLQLLFLKFRTGLRPEITHQITYPLPGEPAWTNAIKLQFFDAENLSITPLIRLQQKVNELVALWYPHLYPTWVLFCILVLTLSVLRRPTIHWMVLVAIVATRIFIPLTMSVPFWRYTVSGWMLLQIITIAWVWLFLNGAKALFKPG